MRYQVTHTLANRLTKHAGINKMKRKDFIEKKPESVEEVVAQAIVKYHTKVELERLKQVWTDLENATWRHQGELTLKELKKAIHITTTVDYTKDRGVEDEKEI